MRRLVNVPFSGFYETIHDSRLEPDADLFDSVDEYDDFYDSINWKESHIAYAKEYCNRYADEFFYQHDLHLKPTFKSLKSPREYNFETDTLQAVITVTGLAKLARDNGFSNWLLDRMRPCSGFIPFYSNDLNDWGKPITWDSNQWGLILEFLHNGDDVYIDNASEYLICK